MIKLRLLFTGFLLILFAACGGGKFLHWKQEVLLQDGRIIVVERISEQIREILPQSNIVERGQVISFKNPDTLQEITWELPAGLLPYTLDFDSKFPYLVLVAYGVGDYNKWGCPNPPFLVYRYDGSNWNAIPFEQLPYRFERRNLIDLGKLYQKYATSKIASISDMKNFLKNRSPDERILSREKVGAMGKGCDPDTLTKLGRSSEINYGR